MNVKFPMKTLNNWVYVSDMYLITCIRCYGGIMVVPMDDHFNGQPSVYVSTVCHPSTTYFLLMT